MRPQDNVDCSKSETPAASGLDWTGWVASEGVGRGIPVAPVGIEKAGRAGTGEKPRHM